MKEISFAINFHVTTDKDDTRTPTDIANEIFEDLFAKYQTMTNVAISAPMDVRSRKIGFNK